MIVSLKTFILDRFSLKWRPKLTQIQVQLSMKKSRKIWKKIFRGKMKNFCSKTSIIIPSVNMDSKEEEESAGEIETDDFFMDDDIDKVINEFLEETDFIDNEFSPLQEV